jgi:hypothetical protein
MADLLEPPTGPNAEKMRLECYGRRRSLDQRRHIGRHRRSAKVICADDNHL